MSLDDAAASTPLGMLCKRLLSRAELLLLYYYKRNPLERAAVSVVGDIYSREAAAWSILIGHGAPVLFSPSELLNIWTQARAMKGHGGAFAEVGAFKGDSAEVTCKAKGEVRFYVFELFEGLPAVGRHDGRFREGLFASHEDELRHRIERFPNTFVIAGRFPDTATAYAHERFSYVHLDVDLHSETLAALEFFYPRMLPGGRILSHDYGQCRGVWEAFDTFFGDKPEALEPLGTSQVMVVKS